RRSSMQDASRINRRTTGGMTRCDGTWRMIRLAGVVATCAWACASAWAQSGGETVVRLYPSAVIAADSITLADVAEVRGESADLAAQLEVGAAPHVGHSGIVEIAHLQAMLARRGVNLSNWVFRGASRCTVTSVARSARSGIDARSSNESHSNSSNTLSSMNTI